MIAPHRRVQRHHQPVVTRHPSHLQQHVPAERGGVLAAHPSVHGAVVDPLGIGGTERLGPSVEVAVIGGRRAVRHEVPATLGECLEVAAIVADVDAGGGPELLDSLRPARHPPVRDSGPGGTSAPPGSTTVGSAASAACAARSSAGSSVVARISMPNRRNRARGRNSGWASRSAIWSYRASAFAADGRCVMPKMPASSLSNQNRTGVPRNTCQWAQSCRQAWRACASGRGPSPTPNVFQWHPVRVQQPGDVVVGLQQQAGRVGERRVVDQQPRVDVPVRGHDRQVPHRVVQPGGDRPVPVSAGSNRSGWRMSGAVMTVILGRAQPDGNRLPPVVPDPCQNGFPRAGCTA